MLTAVTLAVVPGGPAVAETARPGNADGALAQAGQAPDPVKSTAGTGGAAADGDFSYSLDIAVPPGRKGMQPNVALRYRSSGAVHGGVAAGWSLAASAAITVEPAAGTVRPEWPDGGTPAAPRDFRGPGGDPLVPDPTLPVSPGATGYRELGDTGSTRYEYLGEVASSPYWWQATTKDGLTSRYGLKAQTPYGFAPLVEQTDHDGHTLKWVYRVVGRVSDTVPAGGQPREVLLDRIEYLAPGASAAYARVFFEYQAPVFCGTPAVMPAIGSRLDHRLGFAQLSGTRKLTRITTAARRDGTLSSVRRYDLAYTATTESCASPPGAAGPFRELASVTQTAYPPESSTPPTVLPPVAFTYGKAASYVLDSHYDSPAAPVPANLRVPESIDGVSGLGLPGGGTNPGDWQQCSAPLCPLPPNTFAHELAIGQHTGETVSRMFLDVDADGLVDILERPGLPLMGSATPTLGGCAIDVYLNKGRTAGFVKQTAGGEFPPFTLRDAMADVPVTPGTPASGAGELLCGLSRSFSNDASGGADGNPAVPCSGGGVDFPASWGSIQQVAHAFTDVDGDLLPDLLAQPIASRKCPYASTAGVPPPATCTGDAHWEREFSIGCATVRQRNIYVYRNTGSGFATTPVRVPATRPGGAGIAKVPQPSLMGRYFAQPNTYSEDNTSESLVDVNGDGYLDLMYDDNAISAGLKGGGFDFAQPPITLGAVPQGLAPERGRTQIDGGDLDRPDDYTTYHRTGVGADVNADGLPDHVSLNIGTDTGSTVRFNTGTGFGTTADDGQVQFSQNAPDTVTLESAHSPDMTDRSWQEYPQSAHRYHKRALIDVDYDGYPDVLYNDQGAGATAYLGGGRAWTKAVAVDAQVIGALAGAIDARGLAGQFNDLGEYRITQSRQAVDLDGDGLLDLVSDDAGGSPSVRYAKRVVDGADAHNAPARLLRTVANGMGAVTKVSYERDVTAHKWVAARVDVHPGQSQPLMTTQYAYRGPVFTAGPYGRRSFRGFTEVATVKRGDTPGADDDDLTTVARYGYDQSPHGLPVRTVTVVGDDAFGAPLDPAAHTRVMTVAEHTYHVHELNLRTPSMETAYPSRVVLPKATTSYTCTGATGQTLNGCLSTAPRVTRDVTWTPHTDSGTLAAVLPTRADIQFVNADGQSETRRQDTTYRIASGADVFAVAPDTVTARSVLDGSATTQGTTTYTYRDTAFRRIENVTVSDETGSGAASRTTRYAYHGGTGADKGQLFKVWPPNQVERYGNTDTADGYTEYAYDTDGVQVTRVTRSGQDLTYGDLPIDHVTTRTVDAGTGAVLESAGPDWVCPDGADAGTDPDPPSVSCTPATPGALPSRTVTKVDGLGRTLEVSAFPAGTGPGVQVARASYDDRANHDDPGHAAPVTATVEKAAGDGDFSHVTTELDGLGRAVKVTTQQDPQADNVITYAYDAAGRPAVTRGPRGDGLSGTFDVLVTYDALGRVTQVAETGSGNAVFATSTYNGLNVTSSDGPTADGSPVSVTNTLTDPLNQLVKVEEKVADTGGPGGGPRFAVTHYRYDTNGNTKRVQDPDGAVTELDHDFFGQRRGVTLPGGRRWSYDYDHNGNMTKVVEPVPAGASAAAYTHENFYDDLNRIVRHRPAVRNLTSAEIDEFYGRTSPADDIDTHYIYDGPDAGHCPTSEVMPTHLHQIGHLTCTDSSVVRNVTRYDDHGRPVTTRQIIKDPIGLGDDVLQTSLTYDPTGTVESSLTQVFSNSTVGSPVFDGVQVHTGYDRDGTPSTARFVLAGKDMNIANTRNAAGLLYTRNVNTAGTAGFAQPTMAFGHDRYGRLTGVSAQMGDVYRYLQTVAYNDAGEIENSFETLGDIDRPALSTTYTYDARDQLTGVTATKPSEPGIPAVSYSAAFTHTDGGRLASANVASTGALRVTDRNVTYRYQSAATGDPNRLDRLRKSDGTPLATYTYDEAGNTVSRTLPDGSQLGQTWDGPALRRITAPGRPTETLFYDGHRRIAAVHRDSAGNITSTTRWYGAMEVHKPAGGPATYRTYLTLAGQTIGRVDGDAATGTLEHYLTNGQGHHVLALDAAGQGTTQGATTRRVAAYGPYGDQLLELTAEGTAPPAGKYTRQINDKDYDTFAGLHHYPYRWYDGLALQWTSADPMFRVLPDLAPAQPRMANLYTYNLNNPVGNVDPDGLCPSIYACAKGSPDATPPPPQPTLGQAIADWWNTPTVYNSVHTGGPVNGTRGDQVMEAVETFVIAVASGGGFGPAPASAKSSPVHAGPHAPPAGTARVGTARGTAGDGTVTVATSTDGGGTARVAVGEKHTNITTINPETGERIRSDLIAPDGTNAKGRVLSDNTNETDMRKTIYEVSVPDVAGAQKAQRESVGDLGEYELGCNDCVTYASDILAAGGVNVPSGKQEFLDWLVANGRRVFNP
ncbi:RHS repeat-associated core domain-containing protein [Sphaerisporangium sp. B11E5]|uniref:RHS repeat-associated core domain-containing protein n=1 Tax=Sphaerisporangium sp. B11E5 TaxID=3153563 RepID=UPI00325E1398